MKKLITLLCFIAFSAINLHAVEEVLKTYTTGLSYYTDSPNYIFKAFAAHFYLDAPCSIKSVTLKFYGVEGEALNDKFDLLIFDQQGGDTVPFVSIFNKGLLASAQSINVKGEANTIISVTVPFDKPVYFANNQFFVVVNNMTSRLRLLTDTIKKQPRCNGNPLAGGIHRYQSFEVEFKDKSVLWVSDSKSFHVDVKVDFPTKTSPKLLQDVTNDLEMPENLSNSTIASADINNDGFQDLLVAGKLFLNKKGQYFEEKTSAYNFLGTPAANAFIDIDNDGDMDVLFLITNNNLKSKAYINNGDSTFTEKVLNMPLLKEVTSFSIADVNNDGYPDLFVGQSLSKFPPLPPDSLPNYLFLNNANSSAPDFILKDGICTTDPPRRSRGSSWVDFDNDGDLDLYVTNYSLEWDELWQNNGDGTFTNIIDKKELDIYNYNSQPVHNNGTGVDWYDYDNDGDMDLLLPQAAPARLQQFDLRGTTLYKNTGEPYYLFTDTYSPGDRKSGLNIEYEETHAGASWGDVNNDGLADFVISTFNDCRFADLYLQKPDHTFEIKTFEYGLENNLKGTDAAWLDFNNDGKLDLAYSKDGSFRLYKNTSKTITNYIECDLVSKTANKNAIGARVKIYAGKDIYTQDINSGRGLNMQRPFRLHFGLGTNSSVTKIEVRWPGKSSWETFYNMEPNAIAKLVEGEAQAPKPPSKAILMTPINKGNKVALTGPLTWGATKNTVSYEIQIAENLAMTPLLESGTYEGLTPTYSPKTLKNKVIYYWRVRAINAAGPGEWSDIWYFTTVDLISVENAVNDSESFFLNENAPNPFNSLTEITFGIPQSGEFSLDIFTSAGTKIETLMNGQIGQGIYKAKWDADKYSNGIYLCQLTFNGKTLVRKMILAK